MCCLESGLFMVLGFNGKCGVNQAPCWFQIEELRCKGGVNNGDTSGCQLKLKLKK